MNGKDVAPDGKSLIAKATVDNPSGEGDPDTVTCRTPNVVAPAKLRLSHGLPGRNDNGVALDQVIGSPAIDGAPTHLA